MLAPPVSFPNELRTLEQLRDKERELDRRFQELQRREMNVRSALQQTEPNFPRKLLCIRPLVVHSIESDLAVDRQPFVRRCYYACYWNAVLLLYNTATAAAVVSSADSSNAVRSPLDWAQHFSLSLIHLVGMAGAFVVWYFPVYRACSSRLESNYNVAYLGVFAAFVYSVFMTVGVVKNGGCGFLFSAAVMRGKASSNVGLLCLVCSVMWLLHALFFCYVFVRLRQLRADDVQTSIQQVPVATVTHPPPAPGQVV